MRSGASYLFNVGALPDATMVPVFKGWNVWDVYQSDSLDFSPLMIGLDANRRLRIWVEDQIREKAPEATVADPLAWKGSQVEILPAKPTGLKLRLSKEGVSGAEAMLIEMPAKLRTVRFFNRGEPSRLLWPHSDNYLLDSVYTPDEKVDITKGSGPDTIIGGAANQASELVTSGVKPLLLPALIIGGIILIVKFTEVKERTRNVYRRIKDSY